MFRVHYVPCRFDKRLLLMKNIFWTEVRGVASPLIFPAKQLSYKELNNDIFPELYIAGLKYVGWLK